MRLIREDLFWFLLKIKYQSYMLSMAHKLASRSFVMTYMYDTAQCNIPILHITSILGEVCLQVANGIF